MTLSRPASDLLAEGGIAALEALPGIGPSIARSDLERAAHDGRLVATPGFGPRRVAAVRGVLELRLARIGPPAPAPVPDEPPVGELLDVDREYRERAARGELRTIAPRRFNPAREAWLPVLHTQRGSRHYTALFSNTPRAHEMGATRDWVILYYDGDAGERQCTVITAQWGPARGRRIVQGRGAESIEHHRQAHLADAAAAGRRSA